MSFKEKFESHPVPYGLGLIIAGFTAGFAARSYFPLTNTGLLSSSQKTCAIEGLGSLEASHAERSSTLQKQLIIFEAKSSDEKLIGPYQDKYKESAERVRRDLENENNTYRVAIEALRLKCK